MMTETYHISGVLKNNCSIGNVERFERWPIKREVQATNAQAAADAFEADGWEWVKPPTVRLITEAMKMERMGQPSLFPLGEK